MTGYAFFKVLTNFIKVFFRKYSKKEISEQEKKIKTENYYYHCELNPIGFAKLCAENNARETQQKTINEYKARV